MDERKCMDDERTVELTKDSQKGGRYNESEVTFMKFVDEKIEERPARWS
jgi:hypothetical protein